MIKKALLLLTGLAFLWCNENIRINQVGYYPDAVKRALVVNTTSDHFKITSMDGKTVFESDLIPEGYWNASGEQVFLADFSDFTDSGMYVLEVADTGQSHPFSIADDLYDDVLTAAVKSYYFQRLSIPLEAEYAGVYARPAGHPDTECRYHPSSGHADGIMSSPGGWYDAGDYNKYVVNAGITVSALMALYELYPQAVPDGKLNIPESGNRISDLLDEIRYELDWVLTMQDDDGGVFVKLTSKNFCGFIMPHEDDSERWVVGKSTAAALNFAAMTAQAARVYKPIDPPFARKCLAAAEKAWQWTQKNDEVVYRNPEDVVTGAYSDIDFYEEYIFALGQLYTTTRDRKYLKELEQRYAGLLMNNRESWRQFGDHLGLHAVVTVAGDVPEPLKKKWTYAITRLADKLLLNQSMIPYRIPLEEFYWGSTSDVGNNATVLAYAHYLTGDAKYLDGVIETIDYIFGKNATGYSLMTGIGSKYPHSIHHRPSGADNVPDAVPGFVVGGPNFDREDDLKNSDYGVEYKTDLPAKCYVDEQPSYASNEVCLNWNSPVIFILGYLEANQP